MTKDFDELIKKYEKKLGQEVSSFNYSGTEKYSKEYLKFREEMVPVVTGYERWCKFLSNFLKLKISVKDEFKIKKFLEIAHLDLEPWQVVTFSLFSFLILFFVAILISSAVVFINADIASFPFLFFLLMIFFATFLFYFLQGYPQRLANQWRLKASSQMVPAILYIVVYMRHTPNLEKAVAFAAEHLEYPLALDFRKIFYNVEVSKFSTIKESLDNYLEIWRDSSFEFIEGFHLIEGSLFEPDEARRIAILEKSLEVVLDGVYEKMLKFTHNIKNPLTNMYMLGIVLPTLGLSLFPLASAMIGDFLKWNHILIFFNLIIPFFVFYLFNNVLLLRPGGYGNSSLLESNPYYSDFNSKKPYFKAFLIAFPFLVIALLPFVFQFTPIPDSLGIPKDFTFSEIGLSFLGDEKFFDFREGATGTTGPFGIGALLLSLFLPFSVALFFYISYNEKTKNLIFEREKTKQLEDEFTNSLFQLGNRLGNGLPPELVFGKIAESSRGLITENFFRRVNYNVQQMGMSVEQAIFDSKRGAILMYPSQLIATSMRILIESSKKGLKISASSLMSISQYVKNIHKMNERLRDILAEIVSDMRSNITFLAPLLSGIVVGLAAMMTSILGKLEMSKILGNEEILGLGNFGVITQIFQIEKMIPPYFLQSIIGIYLVEIIFILTQTLVSVDSGEDRLETYNKTGRNLRSAIGLYFVVALASIFALFLLTSVILGNMIQ